MGILEFFSIFIILCLLLNCIGIDQYSQNINIIHNRFELNNFDKYSEQQFKEKIKDGKIVECSGKCYCEFWCNPNKKHRKYVLDPQKMKIYEGKSLQYGIDIHEYDFPIVIPNGCIEKKHIYIDIDNLKYLCEQVIKLIKK